MSSPLREVFRCECGKTYASRDSLQSHKRRYCKLQREIPEEDEKTCPECNKEFKSYRSMRLHWSLMHKSSYNAALQEEVRVAGSSRLAWTEDEESALARAEAAYEGEDIIDFLVSISKRTKDAIKARRRTSKYKQKVARFKEEMQQPEEQAAETRLQQQVEDEIEHNTTQDEVLTQFISEIPASQLDEADIEFRTLVLTSSKDDIVQKFDDWVNTMLKDITKRRTEDIGRSSHCNNTSGNVTSRNRNASSRRRRAMAYRLAQSAYKKNRTAYARSLIDGLDLQVEQITPEVDEIKTQYESILSTTSQIDQEPITDLFEDEFEASQPILEEELDNALITTTVNTPGPDGITLKSIKNIPKMRLLLLYNIMLYIETIPMCFKHSRTILIPKVKTELHLVKNWRPITISSMLLRIFNKILAKRLNKIEICNAQRGFRPIDGCFANFATVDFVIKHHRKEIKPLTIVSLDLTKAFDMISHHSIIRAIRRLNIDRKTRNLIGENYKNISTSIACNNIQTGVYSVKRGVKQGDPLSPFLFNAVVDELLVQLNNKFTGIKVGATKLTCLAYADDLVLFANTPEDAQRMLDHSENFFSMRGLHANPEKCKALVMKVVPGKKKLYIDTNSQLIINNSPIAILKVDEQFKYLGHQFNSEGLTECNTENLWTQLQLIMKAPLKPDQKLIIIRQHLLPRYIAVLQRPNVTNKILAKVDKTVRCAVRKVLKLPIHCSNSILYATIKAGGLGIFNFRKQIPIITMSRWERLKNRSELLQQVYSWSEPWITRHRKLIHNDTSSKKAVQDHFEDQLERSYSGNGIKQVQHHSACCSFLRSTPRYWNSEDYLKAVHLRYNLLPSQGIPSNPPQQRLCRNGCFKVESLSHILQQCPLTHNQRIKRHDYIVQRLAKFARSKGWKVTIEAHIRCTDGILKKPDLIFEKDENVIISDVGVNWEGPIALKAQWENKSSIYSTQGFIEKLHQLYPGKKLFVLPFIVGARGAWCKNNDVITQHLELKKYQIEDIIHTTMRGSWIIHREFMKRVWRLQHHNRR